LLSLPHGSLKVLSASGRDNPFTAPDLDCALVLLNFALPGAQALTCSGRRAAR